MGGMFAGLTVDAVQPGAQHQHQQQADGLPQRQGGFAGGSAMPGHPQGAQHAGQSPLDLLGGLGQPAPQQQAAHANAGETCSVLAGLCSALRGIPAGQQVDFLACCWPASSMWSCHSHIVAGCSVEMGSACSSQPITLFDPCIAPCCRQWPVRHVWRSVAGHTCSSSGRW